jgi:hypothetical protein
VATMVTFVPNPAGIAAGNQAWGKAATRVAASSVLGRAQETAPVVTGQYRASLTTRDEGRDTWVGGTARHSSNVEKHHDTLRNALYGATIGGEQ